jgi:predicted acyl esterase
MPLPCDIQMDRDVAITLRDGTVIYADIFRPVENGNYPSILAWSPYGKQFGQLWLDDMPGRHGIPLSATSQLETFEGPDPAYWVNHGYVIINVDKRGVNSSNGNIYAWGTPDTKDGYDVIEWAAKQKWSNGKVGMSGNSWLAAAQWFIAAEKPPHLAAIAPWEGFADLFRENSNRGGIPTPAFPEYITEKLTGNNRIENFARMIVEYPTLNDYWLDKAAQLEKIEAPAYIVASYDNPLHTRGSIDGFRRIRSKEKWLRIHNTHEWIDYYTPQYVEDLTRFFDHYLKGMDNGWETTPRVRMSVLNPGGKDIVDRPEEDFPLERTRYKKLFLNSKAHKLSAQPLNQTDTACYQSTDANSQAVFTYQFEKQTEITGYMKLHLWAQTFDTTDMDIAVNIEKLDKNGNPIPLPTTGNPLAAIGVIRASFRALDSTRTTDFEPILSLKDPTPLEKGEIVPLEISFWPMSIHFEAGEYLCLTIKGYQYVEENLPFGTARIDIPKSSMTFQPGSNPEMVTLGGKELAYPFPEKVVKTPQTVNRGKHIIHAGGKYNSYLSLPFIPKKM